jgi:hypothetical protein
MMGPVAVDLQLGLRHIPKLLGFGNNGSVPHHRFDRRR